MEGRGDVQRRGEKENNLGTLSHTRQAGQEQRSQGQERALHRFELGLPPNWSDATLPDVLGKKSWNYTNRWIEKFVVICDDHTILSPKKMENGEFRVGFRIFFQFSWTFEIYFKRSTLIIKSSEHYKLLLFSEYSFTEIWKQVILIKKCI